MDNEHLEMCDCSQPPDMTNMVKDTVDDFNKAIKSLAETKRSIEQEIITLKSEMDRLEKDKSVLETDIARAGEASEIAMAMRAAEQEKHDTLRRNQELKSYLDSAADTIKGLSMKLTEAESESKRSRSAMISLEKEKSSALKENMESGTKMVNMKDMLKEQDLKIKESTITIESLEEDKKILEKQLKSTREILEGIQKSTISIKDRVRRSGKEPQK